MGRPLSSFTRVARKIHSAHARRAPFVAFATFPPFGGGIPPKGKAENANAPHFWKLDCVSSAALARLDPSSVGQVGRLGMTERGRSGRSAQDDGKKSGKKATLGMTE